MIIAIFTNITKSDSKPISKGIVEFLKKRKVTVVAEDDVASQIDAKPLSSIKHSDVNFIISLGGDGTILRVFHAHPELNAPILGINLGSLGFMADITVEEIYSSLENVLDGKYTIQNRMMMQGETEKKETFLAINDIVIHRAQNASLIELEIFVDNNYLNTFSADGIIISTPNGSTAYSLAAGGPILAPEIESMVITPICPHTISNRPVVLMPKDNIQIRYVSKYKSVEVTYDGFGHYPLHMDERITITRAKRLFRLVNMLNYDYFATLRSKLGWAGKLKSSK